MKNNVVKLYPDFYQNQKQTQKPQSWIKKIFLAYKKKQDETRNYKINYLLTFTYKFYLKGILDDERARGVVDFHPDLYFNGSIVNYTAVNLAVEAVTNHAINEKRLDECYKKCFKQYGQIKSFS